MNIYHASTLKHNLNYENKIILLMTPNGEAWCYLAIKKLSAILRERSSRHDGHFYCFSCFYSFRKKILSHIGKYVETEIFVVLERLLKKPRY